MTRRTPSSRFTVVSTTPSASFGPCALSPRHLHALATKVGEICGPARAPGREVRDPGKPRDPAEARAQCGSSLLDPGTRETLRQGPFRRRSGRRQGRSHPGRVLRPRACNPSRSRLDGRAATPEEDEMNVQRLHTSSLLAAAAVAPAGASPCRPHRLGAGEDLDLLHRLRRADRVPRLPRARRRRGRAKTSGWT